MALAKYYEDILDRLFEENEILTKYLWPDKLPPKEFREHVDSHLRASKDFLNELYKILTDPNVDKSLSLLDKKNLQNENDALRKRVEELGQDIDRRRSLNDGLNAECNTLQRKVERLEERNKALEKKIKKHKIN